MSKMKMQKPLTLVEVREKTSQKSGNKFKLITLGDQTEFQSHTFLLDQGVRETDFSEGEQVIATINLNTNGFNQSLVCVELEPVKQAVTSK